MRIVAILLRVVLPLGAVAAISACSTSSEPTQADMRAKWESGNIPPANYRPEIVAFMRTYLNDPVGVRGTSISQPFRRTLPGDPAERYVVCVRYDARKAGGGYAGLKTGVAVFVSGRFEQLYENPRLAEDTCKEAAYTPYPELQQMTRP